MAGRRRSKKSSDNIIAVLAVCAVAYALIRIFGRFWMLIAAIAGVIGVHLISDILNNQKFENPESRNIPQEDSFFAKSGTQQYSPPHTSPSYKATPVSSSNGPPKTNYHFLLFESKEPLTDDEIKILSNGRRTKYINTHFKAVRIQFNINPRYRESLDRNGRWDRIEIPYYQVFSFLTELLRYKRHEWSVWVLTDENEAKFIWSNKGDDDESCYFSGSQIQLFSLAKSNRCNTVIHFHNHPHTQERYWNLLSPSETDLNTFREMIDTYNNVGLNLISGLCTQGRYMIYGQMFAKNYCPAGCSIEEIRIENGLTEKGNKALHRELKEVRNAKINIIS